MRNVLRANLWRLVKSRAFHLALAAMLAYTALIVLVCWDHYATGTGSYTLESVLTAGFGLMGYLTIPSLIMAPLLALYLGTEYGEHTLRNKLTVGHTRTEIYLADLATCILAAVGLDLLSLLLAGALCVYPVMGMSGVLLRASPGQVLAWIATALLARAAWAAVMKLLTASMGSPSAAAVAALLLVVLASLLCSYGFRQMEYLVHRMADGTAVENGEARLAFWQFLLDLLPTGQSLQVSRLDTPNLWRLPLLSLGVAAASTGAGLVLFHKKDLK